MKVKGLREYNKEDYLHNYLHFIFLKNILRNKKELQEFNRLSKKADRLSTEAENTSEKIFDSIIDLYNRLNEEEVPEAEITSKINEIIEMLEREDKMELEYLETLTKMNQTNLDMLMRSVENATRSNPINKDKIMDGIEDLKNRLEEMHELLLRTNDITKELINIMKKAKQNASQRLELLEQAIEVFHKRDEISDELDKLFPD
ncbi:hypothetical protein [Sulfolobus tengchongensis spindle-shaped virus 4]|nr:hypothetical protein [Sulfolobus tengchongensis spindle-shaped virus 4]